MNHKPIKIVLQSFTDALKEGWVATWPGWAAGYPADYRLFIQFGDWDYIIAFDTEENLIVALHNAANALEKAIKNETQTDSQKL